MLVPVLQLDIVLTVLDMWYNAIAVQILEIRQVQLIWSMVCALLPSLRYSQAVNFSITTITVFQTLQQALSQHPL